MNNTGPLDGTVDRKAEGSPVSGGNCQNSQNLLTIHFKVRQNLRGNFVSNSRLSLEILTVATGAWSVNETHRNATVLDHVILLNSKSACVSKKEKFP